MSRSLIRASLLMFALCARPLDAQTVIDVPAGGVRSAQMFSLLRGARELSDGRLLITDWLEQRLAVIDFERGTVEDRARLGAGPDEFRLPGSLLAFRGDSTLLVDLGNARLAVLDGNGEIRRSFVPRHGAATSPGAADGAGHLYFTIPSWMAEQPLADDSVPLMQLDVAANRAEELMRVRGVSMLNTPSREMRVPFVIFAPQDSWTVTRTGRLAIVRGGDYHVEWRDAAGAVRRGPPLGGRARPVTTEDRRAYVRNFLAASPVGGRGTEGLTLGPAEALSSESVDRVVRASTFAETMPHFRAGELWLDSEERLWVGRSVSDGEQRIYDVFDGAGTRILSIRLASGRRLLTLGRSHLYVVNTDDDGLQTIERTSLPAITRN